MDFFMTSDELKKFHTDGYTVVESPLTSHTLQALRDRHDEIAPAWQSTHWPDHVHKLASQFVMMGEPAFALAEDPALLDAAREVLQVDEVFVGACAAGDTVTAESVDGRPVASLQWHSAPGRGGPYGPRWDQVAFRFPLDEHTPANGGLHVIPRTQDLPKRAAEAAVREAVSHSEDFLEWQGLVFGRHPDQVVLFPVPGDLIVWTPDVWHCTGANPRHLRRRSITWTYFPAGGRFRDHDTIRHILTADQLAAWTPERRRLWGLEL